MNEQEVIDLMEGSQSAEDWAANCYTVKSKCNGYPEFWWSTMIMSGRANKILGRWGGSAEIKVTVIGDEDAQD